jgi:ABC-type antimicrobial peptide transport system permease subunit
LFSTGGGVPGFGFFLSWPVATTAEWRTVVGPSPVAAGVIFGICPAMKAARINPIEALRHE